MDTSHGATIGGTTIAGDHLAAQFIYPNPENPAKFVLIYEGGDASGELLAGAFNLIGSGSGLPDYMIYEASVRTTGWGGVKAAGFFDNTWKAR